MQPADMETIAPTTRPVSRFRLSSATLGRSPLVVLAPVICLALWASLWVAVNTAQNIDHTDPDGGAYIGTADQIRAGHGPTAPSTYKFDDFSPAAAVAFQGNVPSTHFAPGYPAAMAAVSVFTGSTRHAARAINVVLAFANVLMLGILAARMTGFRSVLAATAPVVLVLFVPDRLAFDGPGWLQVYLGVFSEPLFIFFVTGALLATANAITGPPARTRPMFALAAALCAAALLTRYAGIALVVAVMCAFLFLDTTVDFRRRLRRATVFGVVALAPTLVFLGWSASRGGGAARTIAYHPVHEVRLVERIGRFVVPFGWPSLAQVLGFAVLAAILVSGSYWIPRRVRTLWNDDGVALQRLAVLFLALYVIVLVITGIFLDIHTPYDARLVAPMRGVAYAVLIAIAYRYLVAYLQRIPAIVLIALLIAALAQADWVIERFWLDHDADPRHRLTATEHALAALPRDALIVTNAPHLAYLTAGRRSLILPKTLMFLTNKPNKNYAKELAEWADLLSRRGGYGFFTRQQLNIATADDLGRLMPLALISRSGDESLYRIPRQS